jgi:hypothetical protein
MFPRMESFVISWLRRLACSAREACAWYPYEPASPLDAFSARDDWNHVQTDMLRACWDGTVKSTHTNRQIRSKTRTCECTAPLRGALRFLLDDSPTCLIASLASHSDHSLDRDSLASMSWNQKRDSQASYAQQNWHEHMHQKISFWDCAIQLERSCTKTTLQHFARSPTRSWWPSSESFPTRGFITHLSRDFGGINGSDAVGIGGNGSHRLPNQRRKRHVLALGSDVLLPCYTLVWLRRRADTWEHGPCIRLMRQAFMKVHIKAWRVSCRSSHTY